MNEKAFQDACATAISSHNTLNYALVAIAQAIVLAAKIIAGHSTR